MRLNKKFSMLIAIAAITTIGLPGLALAHNKGNDNNEKNETREVHTANVNDLGVRIFDNMHGKHELGNDVLGLFYKGTVTAVSGTGFTINARGDNTIVIDTTNAKLVRIPNTVITLSDIKVNDSVWISGIKTNTGVSAYVVFDLAENVKPAKTKGTVTAVSGNTVTIQTKNDKTVTVTTDANTQVTKADGTVGTSADVTVGSKVKLWGLWDKVANIFAALRIHIK